MADRNCERPLWRGTTRVERFWAKVDKRGPDECWPWVGARNANGYGASEGTTAHRVSYELNVGPIPAGLVIDHLCGQRYCMNPAHLEAVTYAVNSQRGYGGQVLAASVLERARNRTCCGHGHEYTPENTRLTKEGHRKCRACGRLQSSKHRSLNPVPN